MLSLDETLRGRPYPGRGCLAARTGDGTLWFLYFLTGRSEASRRRTLVALPDGDLQVRDTGDGPHDALRHYTAYACRDGWAVLGNGEQVVPLAEDLAAGVAELTAWRRHDHEPDPPINTPRIWLVHRPDDIVVAGWAWHDSRGGRSTDHGLLAVSALPPGTGLLSTTYDGTRELVRTSAGPVDVEMPDATGEELLERVWGLLDPELRVAAAALRPGEPASSATLIVG